MLAVVRSHTLSLSSLNPLGRLAPSEHAVHPTTVLSRWRQGAVSGPPPSWGNIVRPFRDRRTRQTHRLHRRLHRPPQLLARPSLDLTPGFPSHTRRPPPPTTSHATTTVEWIPGVDALDPPPPAHTPTRLAFTLTQRWIRVEWVEWIYPGSAEIPVPPFFLFFPFSFFSLMFSK